MIFLPDYMWAKITRKSNERSTVSRSEWLVVKHSRDEGASNDGKSIDGRGGVVSPHVVQVAQRWNHPVTPRILMTLILVN